MKHILAATKHCGAPAKAGLNDDVCDVLRDISDRLADEAGCPRSKKDQIIDILFFD
jgi:hypothetical protein